MFLLRTNFAKKIDYYTRILFLSLKTAPDQTRNAFNSKFSCERNK